MFLSKTKVPGLPASRESMMLTPQMLHGPLEVVLFLGNYATTCLSHLCLVLLR